MKKNKLEILSQANDFLEGSLDRDPSTFVHISDKRFISEIDNFRRRTDYITGELDFSQMDEMQKLRHIKKLMFNRMASLGEHDKKLKISLDSSLNPNACMDIVSKSITIEIGNLIGRENPVSVLLGLLSHETAHIKFTDPNARENILNIVRFDAPPSKNIKEIEHLILDVSNIIEDERIENLLCKEFPGYYQEIEDVKKELLTKPPTYTMFSLFFLAIRYPAHIDYQKLTEDQKDFLLDLKKLFVKYPMDINEMVITSSKCVLLLARYLKDEKKNPPVCEGQGKNEVKGQGMMQAIMKGQALAQEQEDNNPGNEPNEQGEENSQEGPNNNNTENNQGTSENKNTGDGEGNNASNSPEKQTEENSQESNAEKNEEDNKAREERRKETEKIIEETSLKELINGLSNEENTLLSEMAIILPATNSEISRKQEIPVNQVFIDLDSLEGDDSVRVRDFSKKGDPIIYQRIRKATRKQSSLLNKVIRLKEYSEYKPLKGCISGEIDDCRIVETINGVQNTYIQKTEKPVKSINVAILIDASGSMTTEGKIKEARKSAIMLEKAFTGTKGEMFIYAHTTCNYNYVEIFTLKERKKGNKFSLSQVDRELCGDYNGDGIAIRSIVDRIRKFTKKKMILFVISDGQPTHAERGVSPVHDTANAVNYAKRKGFFPVQVGIKVNKEHQKLMFDDYVNLEDPHQLATELRALLLSRAKKYLNV